MVAQRVGVGCETLARGPRCRELVHTCDRSVTFITDLMLPFLSGAELIAAVRANPDPARAHMPVIVMTAVHGPASQVVGADAILRKPFGVAELQALLQRFLEARDDEGPAPAATHE